MEGKLRAGARLFKKSQKWTASENRGLSLVKLILSFFFFFKYQY